MGLPVKTKIARVLIMNKNGFLNLEQIAERAYEDAYMKETKKHLTGLVKRNVPHAIALLSEEGYLVVKDLAPTVNGKVMSYKTVLGYKIADKEDEALIRINLKTKEERIEIAEQTKLFFEESAMEKGLLTE